MIIDCFPFFNELDLLEIRLNILDDVVDKFVLVEAGHTQTLLTKPFYYEQNQERFEDFSDKIVHIKIDDHPAKGGWEMENYQRNCIKLGLHSITPDPNDIVVCSDVDEIWNPKVAPFLDEGLSQTEFFAAKMAYFVFFLNLETVDKTWIGSVFTRAKSIEGKDIQHMRNIKDHVPFADGGGWHLGYQGGREKVWEKFLSCIEPIDKSLLPTKEKFFEEFESRIKDDGSFIYSDNLLDKSVKLRKVEKESRLPEYLQENKNLYPNLFLP
jgi:beta-1,4-mannosyl-glycoprotein beta-1,4-N-acetylglucosaminyltransferase